MSDKTYASIVTLVRVLLGVEFTINGLNWWVKLITPYPSISDGIDSLPAGDLVAAMIRTGFVFHVVKGVELSAGLLLLLNRFVPLALVCVFPVTVNVFFVDVFMGHHLRSYLMGSGALLMNGFLLLAYLQCYLPFMGMYNRLDGPTRQEAIVCQEGTAQRVSRPRWLRNLRSILGVAAASAGMVMIAWVAVMIIQHFSR